MAKSLPERYGRFAPIILRTLPFLAVGVTLFLVMGRHERLAKGEQGLLEELQLGGLVVLLADACRADARIPIDRTVSSHSCPGQEDALSFLDDIAADRSQAADHTRRLRALIASWRSRGNLWSRPMQPTSPP